MSAGGGPPPAGTGYPPGLVNAHWFNLFNAIGFQIVMGAPVIIYAQSLGASSTVLGLIAALAPLLVILQIPAAYFLHRVGYKRFALGGWGLRTLFVFFVALIPLMFFLDDASKLAAMIAALFCFNLLRGISTAAMMPWFTSLVPATIRGRFLSRDLMCVHSGSLLALLASAMVMAGTAHAWAFSLVFGISAAGSAVSLLFIRKIPDAEAGEVLRRSAQPVPWGAMLRYPPFRELLVFNVVFMAVVGSLGIFTVEYLREIPRFSIATVLTLSAVSFVGALASLPFAGRIVDRAGSRPVLRVALGLLGCVILGWFLVAAEWIPATVAVIAVLTLFAGVAGANFHLANIRIAMATMPEMGRNHFFALFSVITSLGLGASPVLWGMALDVLGALEIEGGFFNWQRHAVYFFAIFLVNTVALLLVSRLHEAPGAGPPKPGVVYANLKRSIRNWQR